VWSQLQSWLQAHGGVVTVLVGVSIATAIVSVLALPLVLAGLPADYFATKKRTPTPLGRRHPTLRWTVRVAKSVAGFILILCGLALLVLPGQGLLMVLAGLVLAEFPGKRRLERTLARRDRVLRAMNWVRRKAGCEPFVPPQSRTASGPVRVGDL